MRAILEANSGDLALLIGNGINLYGEAAGCAGWQELLDELAKRYLPKHDSLPPPGISLPEFYDVLDLAAGPRSIGSLQRQFCELMNGWCAAPQHARLVDWARRHNSPVLTTNFDDLFVKAGDLSQFSLFQPTPDSKAPTDYYPWETYFAEHALVDPCDGFGVWQLHGMRQYSRSVRLGLSHYMGSVERARRWMYRRKQTRIFGTQGIHQWRGKNTWLQIFLTKPLLIFGLGLHENEVFIRWLLIERAKLMSAHPGLTRKAWYVSCEGQVSADDAGKLFFLRSLGVEPIQVASLENIYGKRVWA